MVRIFCRIINKVYYYILRVHNYLLIVFKSYPNVLDSHQSLSIIIEEELSVSRFGDGELMIIRGTGWGFQKYDRELANRLFEILKSDDPSVAICIPDVFKDKSRFTETARQFWHNHILNNLFHWNKYTLKDKLYFDTQFSRFYMDLKDKDRFPERSLYLLKKIWHDKHLLIIEGAGSRLGYKNDLFDNAKSINRILCPAENAFSKYFEILELAKKYASNKLVLIALGMTATVLSFDLARKGFRAIDIGHIDIEYEWYIMKAIKKVPVKYRYMNEVSCREFVDLQDETFVSQILGEVK